MVDELWTLISNVSLDGTVDRERLALLMLRYFVQRYRFDTDEKIFERLTCTVPAKIMQATKMVSLKILFSFVTCNWSV